MRTTPGAGVFLALTERCPLSCAHCSTSSTSTSPLWSDEPVRRLVGSFTDTDHPELIFMSGGEPFLKPDLVQDLSDQAHLTSTRTSALSGMFFARGRMPVPIRRAIASLDHFSASIDEFHEREVPRERVFAALGEILDLVPAVSLHVAATDQSYLDNLLPSLERAFGERIPVLVNFIRPMGRARDFVAAVPESADSGPCELAAWPLMDYDGTVYACCRPSIGRHFQPSHLILGHASHEDWAVLSARSRSNSVLRAVRAIGPVQAAHLNGLPPCDGVCQTCVSLPPTLSIPPAVEHVAQQLVSRLRPRDLALRWGAGRHAHLTESGWSPPASLTSPLADSLRGDPLRATGLGADLGGGAVSRESVDGGVR